MTVSILDVIQSIGALLPEGVTSQIGPEHAGETIAPPRVVWIPASESFGAPPNRGAQTRRAIQTIASTWEVVIFARGDERADPTASFRALERLRDAVLDAVHRVCRGNATAVAGRYDQQDGGAVGKFGRTYTLTVQFSVEVLSTASLSPAPIESTNVTGALDALIAP